MKFKTVGTAWTDDQVYRVVYRTLHPAICAICGRQMEVGEEYTRGKVPSNRHGSNIRCRSCIPFGEVGPQPRFVCPEPGCKRSFEAPAGLTRHLWSHLR